MISLVSQVGLKDCAISGQRGRAIHGYWLASIVVVLDSLRRSDKIRHLCWLRLAPWLSGRDCGRPLNNNTLCSKLHERGTDYWGLLLIRHKHISNVNNIMVLWCCMFDVRCNSSNIRLFPPSFFVMAALPRSYIQSPTYRLFIIKTSHRDV